MDPLFEGKLVKGLKNKESAAFEKFVQYFQKDLYNLSLKYIGNEEDALDVTQEIFIKILKKIDTFEGNSKLSTWVYRITVNYCKDFLKKHKKVKSISLDKPIEGKEGNFVPELEDDSETPQKALESKLQRESLIKAIGSLDEDQREIIILRYINDLTYNEISEILNLPLGTIKSRLNRGRKRLTEILRDDGT